MMDTIVIQKRIEAEQRKKTAPLRLLEERIAQQAPPLDFALALSGNGVRLIAEVKHASPSRGVLCPDFNPVVLATAYARGGAAAISVLTDETYFQGSLDHLSAIRREVKLPLLRKDFIVDPYQVYESRAYGADAVLLIVAILTDEQLTRLLRLSHMLGMQCLVEAHNENEIQRAVDSGAEIIGINARDLKTFTVDLNTVCRLRPLIPDRHIVVGESGIQNRHDIEKLRACGVNAVLVGETLVAAPDIPTRIRELMG